MVWLHPEKRQATVEEIASYYRAIGQKTRFSYDGEFVDYTVNGGMWTAVSTRTSEYHYADGEVSKWGEPPVRIDGAYAESRWIEH